MNTPLLKKIYRSLRMFWLLSFRYKIKNRGKGFYMGKHNFINCKKLVLGNHVYMGSNCHLSVDDIFIDDYSMLASHVSIVGGDHRFDMVGTPTRSTGRAERKGVTIGKDVWVGHGAIILDGVTIHEGAVIAAGAVVTKPVEAYSIYGGVPAKKIGVRFNDEQIKEHRRKNNFY